MAYKVEINKSGARSAKKLLKKHPELKSDFETAIEMLRLNPLPDGCKKLSGTEGAYRIKFGGDYRLIYSFDAGVLVVTLVLVADRKEVYEQLKKNLGW